MLPEGCQVLSVNFANRSLATDACVWDFGDGNTSADCNASHLFLEPGTFNVQLIAQSNNGCQADTASAEIQVWIKPVAEFSLLKEEKCGTPNEVRFFNSSQNDFDSFWDFGDSRFSDIISPAHIYEAPGVYPVTLVVANAFGCRDTTSNHVEIYGQPFADFEVSQALACEGAVVTLRNLSEEAFEYVWRVESFPERAEITPVYVFRDTGHFDVELVAIYNDFCRDSLLIPNAITIYRSPLADFFAEVDPAPNIIGDIQFVNLSLLADRYSWDLGDGNITTEIAPYHEYDINGPISVQTDRI